MRKSLLAAALLAAACMPAVAAPDAPKATLKGEVVPLDPSSVNNHYAASPAASMPKRQLGKIERWRYNNCKDKAAHAPTPLGVNTALQQCREQFGQ